jgi:hypothetical protein
MTDKGNGGRSATIYAAAAIHATAVYATVVHATTVHATTIYPSAVPDRGVSYDVRPAASIGPPVKARATSSRD